ncbi:MAG: hypothetical protein QXY86_00870 [Candidatus Micrarchaeaceae archaeon]
MQMNKSREKGAKEPRIIVKPIGRFGGLDGIHLALIIVIMLLIALLLVVSYSKPVIIKQANNTTIAKPIHNSTEVLEQVQKLLASYSTANSSLSLLPYITEVQNASATYVPSAKEWLVKVPAENPSTGIAFSLSFLVNDTNISNVLPLIQTAMPSVIGNNSVVYQGVIKLYNKYQCSTQKPLQLYWFIDPYAPGSVRSLLNATALGSEFGKNISIDIKIFSTQATQAIAKTYGIANAQLLGKFIFCASNQSGFAAFVSNLNSEYTGSFMSLSELSNIANESGLNYAPLMQCVNSSQAIINNQALLAQYYNITQTPSTVVDCEYMTIPETARNAICYANSTICR